MGALPKKTCPRCADRATAAGARKGRQLLAGGDPGWPAGPGLWPSPGGLDLRTAAGPLRIPSPDRRRPSPPYPRIGGPRRCAAGLPSPPPGGHCPVLNLAATAPGCHEANAPRAWSSPPANHAGRPAFLAPAAAGGQRPRRSRVWSALAPPCSPPPSMNAELIGMAGAGGDGVVSAGESLMGAPPPRGLPRPPDQELRLADPRRRVVVPPAASRPRRCSRRAAPSTSRWRSTGTTSCGSAPSCPWAAAPPSLYDAAAAWRPTRLPLAGVRPAEPCAGAHRRDGARGGRHREGQEHGRARACSPAGSASRGEPLLDRHPREARAQGRRGRRGQRARLRGRRSPAPRAPAAAPPSAWRRRAAAGPKLLADGNEMCAAAAIFAGCEFFGGYPITPSTEIMQALGRDLWRYGGAVLQAEDEIAGIGAAVGASFAGRQGHDRDLGAGHVAEDGDAGPGHHRRAAAGRA